jgi:hypothetical protein
VSIAHPGNRQGGARPQDDHEPADRGRLGLAIHDGLDDANDSLLTSGVPVRFALTDGFGLAFWVATKPT